MLRTLKANQRVRNLKQRKGKSHLKGETRDRRAGCSTKRIATKVKVIS
jgi:hypothetical protein